MKKATGIVIATLIFGGTVAMTSNQSAHMSAAYEAQRISEYIKKYPAIKQKRMRDAWLKEHKQGEWQHSGAVTAEDRTVVTPQADVNYGYSWFNISERPVVVTLPKYDHYYSLSVFDMNHYVTVKVGSRNPTVIRLPHQKSPINGPQNEVVINTNWGLAFTRHLLVDQTPEEIEEFTKEIKIIGGKGSKDFVIPRFGRAIVSKGQKIIQAYAYNEVRTGDNLFCSENEGCGDLDRAAGVMVGQLGTQSYVAKYTQYLKDSEGVKLKGDQSYQLRLQSPDFGLRSEKGYWSVTVYDRKDRYLIPNEMNKYSVNSRSVEVESDGSVTVNINPRGDGMNGIPTNGKDFRAVLRFYEPNPSINFPQLKRVNLSAMAE